MSRVNDLGATLVVVTVVAVLVATARGQTLDELINQVFNGTAGPTEKSGGGAQIGGGLITAPNSPNVPQGGGGGGIDLTPKPGGGIDVAGGGGAGACLGECVPYYLCSANNSIITDGVGLIDIRIQGPCDSYLDVCCGANEKVPEPITPPPQVNKHPAGCGYRNPEGVGFRITGDKDSESQFGEFPWMVAVLREESVDGKTERINVYQCGGSLIHPQVVLTAAHCVAGKDPLTLKIRAGEWDTQTKNELLPHQDREVGQLIVHPQFYKGALFNDVALLFLRSPVELADNVATVCLPAQDEVMDGSRCFASGWGKDVFGKEGKYQVILKKVELPIVPNGPCQSTLRTTRLGKFFELHHSFICAGGESGRDTCKGDGGSPLVCPVRGGGGGGGGVRYQQAGVVAWGIGCGEDSIPGVYGAVAKFRDWIDEQMVYNNLDRSSYSY